MAFAADLACRPEGTCHQHFLIIIIIIIIMITLIIITPFYWRSS